MTHEILPIWIACLLFTVTATRPSDSSEPEGTLSAVLHHTRRIPSWSLEDSSNHNDASALPSAFLERGAQDTETVDETATADGDLDERPNAGKEADVVKFGITFRQLYGMSLADGTYTADIVLNFRWKDSRTEALVKTGDHLTLSAESAKSKLWMPEMGVTNRNIAGVEVLSTAVTISKGGEVLKVQRVLAVLKNKFNFADYPFDSQTLLVIVSSSKYMMEDVVLEAIEDEKDSARSQVKDGAFEGKGVTFESFKPVSFTEISGALKKSRGRLEVVVTRESRKFYDSVLWPCLFLVACSYMVFWLPLLTPFVMPRIATGMISFLAMYSLAQKYDNMIGPGAGASDGDAYMQGFGALMFSTVVINVALEATAHELKEMEFAQSLNAEMKMAYPAMFVLTYLQVCILGYSGMITLAASVIGYGVHSYHRFMAMKEGKQPDEPEKSEKTAESQPETAAAPTQPEAPVFSAEAAAADGLAASQPASSADARAADSATGDQAQS